MDRRLFPFIHTKLDLTQFTLFEAVDGPSIKTGETEIAPVLSLSLHRLQRTPRAVHLAYLSRPTLFRPHRNIKALVVAEQITIFTHREQFKTTLARAIAGARDSLVLVGGTFGDHELIDAAKRDQPSLEVRKHRSESGERVVIIDERLIFMGAGEIGVLASGPVASAVRELYQPSRRALDIQAGSNSFPIKRIDLSELRVGLARTWVARDLPPIIENERLILSAIRSARRFILIETEALTSPVVVHALAAKLREDDSTEIVIRLPERAPHRLQHLQRAAIARLAKADRHDRFRAYVSPERGSFMIVDDQFLMVGNSQMTSRSLSVSRGVSFAFEAAGCPTVVMAIARLRRERLGSALGIEASEFDARFLMNGSLISTIESFFTAHRELKEIAAEVTAVTQIAFSLSPLLDPKRPRAASRWLRRKVRSGLSSKILLFALIFITIFALLVMFASLFAPVAL